MVNTLVVELETRQKKKEVSTQPYYKHPKGWYVLRPKKISVANAMTDSMNTACANPNVGYDHIL